MKLFHSPLSPYVRKVKVVAHEAGMLDEIEMVDVSGTPTDPNDEVVAANPVGKIPVLEADDGQHIVDSRVICRYLDDKAGLGLYPHGATQFPVLTREAIAEGMIDAALLAAYEARLRPEEIRYAPWVEGQLKKVMNGAKYFEYHIDAMAGHLTIDKIALACCLGYVDFRHADLGWRDDCPALTAWYNAFCERQSMKDTAPSQ